MLKTNHANTNCLQIAVQNRLKVMSFKVQNPMTSLVIDVAGFFREYDRWLRGYEGSKSGFQSGGSPRG